jgi:hypothetical protein
MIKKLISGVVLATSFLFTPSISMSEVRTLEGQYLQMVERDYKVLVQRICINGYEYVVVKTTESVSVTQSFEVVAGRYALPKKCE